MNTFARFGTLFAFAALITLPACGWLGGDDTSQCNGCGGWQQWTGLDLAGQPTDLAAFIEDLGGQPDLTPPPSTDGGTGSLSACETCLNIGCGTPLNACEADANCATTLACMVSASCFASDPSSAAFGSCVDGCTAVAGLTLAQSQAVVTELGAMSACYGYCTTECNGS